MAQLNEQQYLIGRLPWIEVNRGDERLRFARLDLSLMPDAGGFALQGAMAENGISVTHLPGGAHGFGYLQVSLSDQSGKNLDVYRMAATDWSVSPENDTKLLAGDNQLRSQEPLKHAHRLEFNSHTVLDGLKNSMQDMGYLWISSMHSMGLFILSLQPGRRHSCPNLKSCQSL